MIKFLIPFVSSLVLATAAMAAEPMFVNAGSETGVFRQILNDIGESVDHNFVQAGTPAVAANYLQSDNVLTVWSSEWPGNDQYQNPKVTNDNIIALMTYETMVCSRSYDSFEDMSGKTVKVATWGSDTVGRFVDKLGETHNVNFTVVPYDGSGSMTRGYLGGDTDTIFTITSKKDAITTDSSTNCFAFSSKGDLSFRFLDAIVAVNMNPTLLKSIRDATAELVESEDWGNKFAGASFYLWSEDADLVKKYKTAVENFSGK